MDQSKWSTPFPLVARVRAELNLDPNEPFLEEHLENYRTAQADTSPSRTSETITNTDNPTSDTENIPSQRETSETSETITNTDNLTSDTENITTERETSENQMHTSEYSTNVNHVDVEFEDNEARQWGFNWDPVTFVITDIESDQFAEENELQVGWTITAFNGDAIDNENREEVNQELLLKNSCMLTFQAKYSTSEKDSSTDPDQTSSKLSTTNDNLENTDSLTNTKDTTNDENQNKSEEPSENNSTNNNQSEANNEDESPNFEDEEEYHTSTGKYIALLLTTCVAIFFFWRTCLVASCDPVELWSKNHDLRIESVADYKYCFADSKTSHGGTCKVNCIFTDEKFDMTCQNGVWNGEEQCSSCPALSSYTKWPNSEETLNYMFIKHSKAPVPNCFSDTPTLHKQYCSILPDHTKEHCQFDCNNGEWQLPDEWNLLNGKNKCIPSNCGPLKNFLSSGNLNGYNVNGDSKSTCNTVNVFHYQKCILECPWDEKKTKKRSASVSCYNGDFKINGYAEKCAALPCHKDLIEGDYKFKTLSKVFNDENYAINGTEVSLKCNHYPLATKDIKATCTNGTWLDSSTKLLPVVCMPKMDISFKIEGIKTIESFSSSEIHGLMRIKNDSMVSIAFKYISAGTKKKSYTFAFYIGEETEECKVTKSIEFSVNKTSTGAKAVGTIVVGALLPAVVLGNVAKSVRESEDMKTYFPQIVTLNENDKPEGCPNVPKKFSIKITFRI